MAPAVPSAHAEQKPAHAARQVSTPSPMCNPSVPGSSAPSLIVCAAGSAKHHAVEPVAGTIEEGSMDTARLVRWCNRETAPSCHPPTRR